MYKTQDEKPLRACPEQLKEINLRQWSIENVYYEI